MHGGHGMNRIVISGYYGFGNAGDEAMLAAILEAILEVLPDADITVISGNPSYTKKKHGVRAIGRFSMFRILYAMARCDILISGGGSLLQDVTSKRSLYYYLSIIRLATFFGKKVMLYAQGIGPLRRPLARHMVRKVLDKVSMITVRDERSKSELKDIGIAEHVPIQVTADAVLAMHPVDIELGKRLLSDYHISGVKPRIGVSVRVWKKERAYRKELAQALDRLQDELDTDIVFIPMQYPSDAEEAQAVADLMEHQPIVLKKQYTTTELLALCGYMDVLIGVRLHALVFASLMMKPVVGISYDPKILNFLHMIGEDAVGTLANVEAHTIYTQAREALVNQTIKEHVRARITYLREESLKNAHIALTLLDK